MSSLRCPADDGPPPPPPLPGGLVISFSPSFLIRPSPLSEHFLFPNSPFLFPSATKRAIQRGEDFVRPLPPSFSCRGHSTSGVFPKGPREGKPALPLPLSHLKKLRSFRRSEWPRQGEGEGAPKTPQLIPRLIGERKRGEAAAPLCCMQSGPETCMEGRGPGGGGGGGGEGLVSCAAVERIFYVL